MVKFNNIVQKKMYWKGRPFVDVHFLTQKGHWKSISIKFDSGADVSMFGEDIAKDLEIDSIINQNSVTLKQTNGEPITGFLHALTYKIGLMSKKKFRIEGIFVPGIKGKKLLGRKDFLQNYGVIMDSNQIHIFD